MQDHREGAWSGWPGQTESGRFLGDGATSLLRRQATTEGDADRHVTEEAVCRLAGAFRELLKSAALVFRHLQRKIDAVQRHGVEQFASFCAGMQMPASGHESRHHEVERIAPLRVEDLSVKS